jgi:F-type H+-transporting ATPase subunit b
VLIDWFTVCAQALNFLILVWLLERYLYKPVLAAIDAREKKVAAKIKDAEAQETKAQTAGEEFRKRNEAFDRERDGLMHKAADEGAAERQRLIESARQDSQLLRVKLTQSLAAERAELGRQLSLRTQAEVFALTRKALSELAGASLEDRMIGVVIERLRALPEQQKLALAGSSVAAGPAEPAPQVVPGRVVLVRSALDPSPAQRTRLEAAIHELSANLVVRFETAPEFVCGLELSVAGVKLAWSVADYLSTLAQDAAALAATALAGTAQAGTETADVH